VLENTEAGEYRTELQWQLSNIHRMRFEYFIYLNILGSIPTAR